VNQILAIPFEIRLVVLFVLGTCIGSLANLCIYRLAWHPRCISPWSRPDPEAPRRRLTDRVPIFGWLGLRREAGLHGSDFWVRPLAVDLLTGIGLAALYWWEIGCGGLLPRSIPRPLAPGMLGILHAQYAAHVALVALMIVASMIDADEKIIPDTITVPGTLLGLLLAAVFPWSLLPDLVNPIVVKIQPAVWQLVTPGTWPQFLRMTSPISPIPVFPLNVWPAWLNGAPHGWSLLLGLGCWWLWCVGLMPRSWYSRHGFRRAWQLFVARLVRESATYRILVLGLIGSLAIAAGWFVGNVHWVGLLSGLVGMAVGGGLVWTVRIIGARILRREAMGFGDVTLLAMIGTFLGWQTCLMIFFIAPFAALIVGAVQWIVRRDNVIPYGPFLCLATVVAIVRWAALWDWLWPFFVGWLVPMMMVLGAAMLAIMLGIWQRIRTAL